MFQTFIMLQRFHLFDNIKSITNTEKWKWKNKVIKQKLENYNYKHDLELRRGKKFPPWTTESKEEYIEIVKNHWSNFDSYLLYLSARTRKDEWTNIHLSYSL